jgi:hypothetical protein
MVLLKLESDQSSDFLGRSAPKHTRMAVTQEPKRVELSVQVLDLLLEPATELVDTMQSPFLWAVGEYKEGCLYVRASAFLEMTLQVKD